VVRCQRGIVLGRDQVTRIVASPLRRALETATAIGTECRREVVVDFRLVDRDYGIFAGRRQGAVEKAWGSIEGAPGVEPSGEVRGRAMAALADAARDATEGAVVVVSHDAVIRLCLVACDPSLGDPAGLAQGTGHFNVVEIRSGTWRVLDVNVRPPTTLPR
jgi:broad specificity phosphatase PhoE